MSGSISQKTQREVFCFYAENRCLLCSCKYVVSVRDDLWALKMTSYWPYEVRSWSICSKRFTDMPWVTGIGSFRKRILKRLIPTETPDCWLLFWSPVVGLDVISPLSPVLGPRRKSGYVTLFRCSWRSVWYQICDIRVDTASGIRGRHNLGWFARTSLYRHWNGKLKPNSNQNPISSLKLKPNWNWYWNRLWMWTRTRYWNCN